LTAIRLVCWRFLRFCFGVILGGKFNAIDRYIIIFTVFTEMVAQPPRCLAGTNWAAYDILLSYFVSGRSSSVGRIAGAVAESGSDAIPIAVACCWSAGTGAAYSCHGGIFTDNDREGAFVAWGRFGPQTAGTFGATLCPC